jgi:hypothetical protein
VPLIRIVCVIATLGLSTVAIYRLAWLPYQCNVFEKRAEQLGPKLVNDADSLRTAAIARRTIEQMERCVAVCPTDVDLYMIIGYYDGILGRMQHASATYTEALKYDRRPELFFDLGATRLDMNQRDAAIESFTRGCMFNRFLSAEIADPGIRDAVLRRVDLERIRGIAAARHE